MIKLSDYLNYLNSEIVQARKKADEEAVKTAQEYAKDEYLKFFRVPRFSMPSVKLDVPVKISEINADTKYNFKMNQENFIADVNAKIREVNDAKGINISPISKGSLDEIEFAKVKNTLEKRDYRFVKRVDDSINKVDFSKSIRKILVQNEFGTADSPNEKEELNLIFKDAIRNQFTPVATKLNDIFIDPDTTKESDKDKILLNLHVVMEDEGIRIVKMRDKDGNELEEIIFE